MISRNEALIIAQEKMRAGEMTTDQANVYMVQLEGVHVVSGRIPASTRKALNQAVKNKEIGHIKKEGLKPEVYHHKNARANALEARNRIFNNSVTALQKVAC